MKKCATCQCVLETTAFWKKGAYLQSSCKECQRRLEKERRQAHPERYREKHRRFYANHREEIQERRRDYQIANPEAYQARIATRVLERQPCQYPLNGFQICGSPSADAHHEDYSKPLDVTWLCRQHHQIRHQELLK